jgi:hypothetical protein
LACCIEASAPIGSVFSVKGGRALAVQKIHNKRTRTAR